MRTKKQINIEVGERIRIARERKNLTQEQFAEKIDVSPQYISDLERGVVGTSLSTLKRICIVLSSSADEILFGLQSDRSTTLNAMSSDLTDYQFSILIEIVENFLQAIQSAQSDKQITENN